MGLGWLDEKRCAPSNPLELLRLMCPYLHATQGGLLVPSSELGAAAGCAVAAGSIGATGASVCSRPPGERVYLIAGNKPVGQAPLHLKLEESRV